MTPPGWHCVVNNPFVFPPANTTELNPFTVLSWIKLHSAVFFGQKCAEKGNPIPTIIVNCRIMIIRSSCSSGHCVNSQRRRRRDKLSDLQLACKRWQHCHFFVRGSRFFCEPPLEVCRSWTEAYPKSIEWRDKWVICGFLSTTHWKIFTQLADGWAITMLPAISQPITHHFERSPREAVGSRFATTSRDDRDLFEGGTTFVRLRVLNHGTETRKCWGTLAQISKHRRGKARRALISTRFGELSTGG